MSTDETDQTELCADDCGASCCVGGAFLRPADVVHLRRAGHGDAIGTGTRQTRTDGDGNCTLLDADNRCTCYDDRPLDCRLFPIGFELDDECEAVHVVLVGCPLAEVLTEETIDSYVAAAESALTEFSAESLRAYDELPFTDGYDRIATIPYDTLEIDP